MCTVLKFEKHSLCGIQLYLELYMTDPNVVLTLTQQFVSWPCHSTEHSAHCVPGSE